jgi:hypothetical protein
MKKLFAFLLLALPLSAAASHETGKREGELFNYRGVVYEYCRWIDSIRTCYDVEVWNGPDQDTCKF